MTNPSRQEGPPAGELSLHLGLVVKLRFFDFKKADSPHVISTACPPGSSSLQVQGRSDPELGVCDDAHLLMASSGAHEGEGGEVVWGLPSTTGNLCL